jgi:hypothetical protein
MRRTPAVVPANAASAVWMSVLSWSCLDISVSQECSRADGKANALFAFGAIDAVDEQIAYWFPRSD